MKKLLTAALFLLFPLSAICQTESFTRSFFVELHQDGHSPKGSFSIKPDQQTLLGTSSYLADTNSYDESIFPHNDQPQRLGGYRVKTSFFESISWELIYAAGALVAYQLVMTSDDSALSTKPHSWIPVEAFFAVGWLLQSYWNTDSPMFSPINKLEASQDDPFAITTMMLPGNSQKQSQQRKEQIESSGQQASGTSAQLTGSVTRLRHLGSGGGNEEPDQPQHTLGLNCHVDSCHGVCKLRQSSHSEGTADWSLNPEANSTGDKGATSKQSLLFAPSTHLRQRQTGITTNKARFRRHLEIKFLKAENLLRLSSSIGNSDLMPSIRRQALEAAACSCILNHPNIAYWFADPETKAAATKLVSLYTLYSLPHSDDSQEPKRKSKKALCELVIDNTKYFHIILTYIAVPGCGRLKPERFLAVMLSLCESAYQDAFPKTVIGIGSGQAFLEKCFSLMGDVNVKCYDKEPLTNFLPVEQAEFPKDIDKCLPDDCSHCLLVSGYPQGYLGPVLSEFIRRGGEMLCTTIENDLFSDMHEGYEDDPEVLRDGIRKLRNKNGECFEVELTDYTIMGPQSCIQFYNWPSSVKQLMLDSDVSSALNGLCSDIEFPPRLGSSSDQ